MPLFQMCCVLFTNVEYKNILVRKVQWQFAQFRKRNAPLALYFGVRLQASLLIQNAEE